MNLYIDKENVEALIQARTKGLYQESVNTIKKQLSVFFNFSKKDLKNNEVLMSWFQGLSEGVGKTNSFTFMDENVVPSRPIAENCHNDFSAGKLSAIYLLSDDNIDHLRSPGAVLVGSPGEEIEVFNRLFLLQRDYDFHKEIKIGCKEFSCWEDLRKYSLPLTDIIFVDSYILSDQSLIPSNFIKYLEVLCQCSRCPVNIVAYVNIKNVMVDPAVLHKEVIASIGKSTGYIPRFTLIQYTDQRGIESLAEHDRTILTNYVRIKSGDSYNYFDSSGKQLTKGREISYLSLAKKDNHDLAKTLIGDLQKRIDFLKANGSNIFGDRVSNYLILT
jgi:hypothetical protein